MSAVVATQKLREVRLYGRMGAMFGRRYRLAVNSPAEAVRALCVQLPGFEHYLMTAKDKGFGFSVFIGKRNLTEENLHDPPGNEPIRIAPILFGAKNQGWMSILIGAVLVVAGVVLAPYIGPASGALISAGIGMMVGGVVQLLMPQPKMDKPSERPENTPSYAFAGPVNTTAQGHPVPLLYGEMIVGSAVISAGIEAKDEVYIPEGGAADEGGGGGANVVDQDGTWRWGNNTQAGAL